jgi:transcriptional regulator with XRE-family HTH domain
MKTDEEVFYKFLGSKIASERNRFGITQEKLASVLGLSRVSIVNLEKGKQKPSIYQLYLITKEFDISLDSFFSSYDSNQRMKSEETVLGREIDEKSLLDLNNFLSKIKK